MRRTSPDPFKLRPPTASTKPELVYNALINFNYLLIMAIAWDWHASLAGKEIIDGSISVSPGLVMMKMCFIDMLLIGVLIQMHGDSEYVNVRF